MSFTYIASPYTHPDPAVRGQRHAAAMEFTAWALRNRIWCYSPIVHCHEIAQVFGLPYDFHFWQDYNRAMLTAARHLIVLQIEGWQTSKGVFGEIMIAKEKDIPISYMYPLGGGYQVEGNKDAQINADFAEVEK